MIQKISKSALARVSIFLLMGLSFAVHAQTIVLSVPGAGSLVYLPVQLAVAIQADRAEGLELKLRFFSGGPLALRDMDYRNSDFAVVGLPAIASARADAMPVLAIGQLSHSAMMSLMVRSDLKTKVRQVAQLKGMRVGINSSTRTARSTSQMLTEYLVKRAGLVANEVQVIPAGQSREAQRAALQSGSVDAVMGDEPFASELEQLGQVDILVDLYSPQKSSELLGGPFVHAALATREDVFLQHPQTVVKVQRMFDRSLQWIASHTARELVVKLAGQPGFDVVSNQQQLLAVLQRNPNMYPRLCAWDELAVATTEKFFLSMADGAAEKQIRFADFVKKSPLRGLP